MGWVEGLEVEKRRLERGDGEGTAQVGILGGNALALMVVKVRVGF